MLRRNNASPIVGEGKSFLTDILPMNECSARQGRVTMKNTTLLFSQKPFTLPYEANSESWIMIRDQTACGVSKRYMKEI